MKRGLLLAFVLLFGMVSVAAAAPNVANTSQQGSVLIFPKIDVTDGRDTAISISNGFNQPVFIKCYWVTSNQTWQDFMFELTANQPIVFSAATGLSINDPKPITIPPFPTDDSTVGELKCWAVDNAGANQIRWNFLMGSAKVIDFSAFTAYEYNAWTFTALVGANGAAVGTGGNITLDGVNYEACPQYFLGNFNASGSAFGFFEDTDLTLVPCKEDIRQDRTPTFTKALFNIWNENEVQYSGAFKCIKCWFEGELSTISDKFTFRSLHTAAARFRATGVKSTVCTPAASQVASPLIGLLVEELDFSFGGTTPIIVKTASTGFGSGLDGSGFILWDTLAPPVEAARR